MFIHGGSLNFIPAIHFYALKSQSHIRDLIILKKKDRNKNTSREKAFYKS